MDYLMGIDIGTSSLKMVIMNPYGDIISTVAKEYYFDVPYAGYAEQDPFVWWDALVYTTKGFVKKRNRPG